MLANARVIDLSQPISPATVPWPGTFAPEVEVFGTVAANGYYARAVRFFEEEEYAKSQAMVADWEVLGDKGFRQAERLLSELENPV